MTFLSAFDFPAVSVAGSAARGRTHTRPVPWTCVILGIWGRAGETKALGLIETDSQCLIVDCELFPALWQNLHYSQQGSQRCRNGSLGSGLDIYICYPGPSGTCRQEEQRPVWNSHQETVLGGSQRFPVWVQALGVILGQKVETERIRWGSRGGWSGTGGVNRPGWFRAFSWCSSSPMVRGGFKALRGTQSKSVKLRDLLTCIWTGWLPSLSLVQHALTLVHFMTSRAFNVYIFNLPFYILRSFPSWCRSRILIPMYPWYKLMMLN